MNLRSWNIAISLSAPWYKPNKLVQKTRDRSESGQVALCACSCCQSSVLFLPAALSWFVFRTSPWVFDGLLACLILCADGWVSWFLIKLSCSVSLGLNILKLKSFIKYPYFFLRSCFSLALNLESFGCAEKYYDYLVANAIVVLRLFLGRDRSTLKASEELSKPPHP